MSKTTADLLYATLFGSKAARDGAVVRRKVRDVEAIVGREAFRCELDRRGYSAIENAGQFVIFCNREPILAFTGGAASASEAVAEPARGFWKSFRVRKLGRRPLRPPRPQA